MPQDGEDSLAAPSGPAAWDCPPTGSDLALNSLKRTTICRNRCRIILEGKEKKKRKNLGEQLIRGGVGQAGAPRSRGEVQSAAVGQVLRANKQIPGVLLPFCNYELPIKPFWPTLSQPALRVLTRLMQSFKSAAGPGSESRGNVPKSGGIAALCLFNEIPAREEQQIPVRAVCPSVHPADPALCIQSILRAWIGC